jgi:DNA-binding NarL/FixJ family response regulator
LRAVIEVIGAPVFVVGAHGEVLHANSNGRTMLRRDPSGISRSLATSIAGGSSDPAWGLTPLTGDGVARCFLAILRSAPHRATLAAPPPIQNAIVRWKLTVRQAEVLELVARGMTNITIAETMGIAEGTVEFHLTAIFDKAGADNRAMLLAKLLDL